MVEGKVYVIGGENLILPFRAGGAVLCPASEAADVASALDKISRSRGTSLVLITEAAAAKAVDEIREFELKGAHAVLIVPTREVETSVGLERVRDLIVRSVGVDLIARAPSEAVGEEIAL